MALIDDLLFETERRSILFHKDTSMPDATQLGYDGDPNNAVPGNSDGEFLLHNCPSGTNYLQKNTTPYTKWSKVDDAAGGLWTIAGTGAAVVHLLRIFTVTADYLVNEVIDISTGNGSTAGTASIIGSTITSIGVDAASFNNNTTTGARINGMFQVKSVEVIWDSATSIHFNVALDVGDTFEVLIDS